MSHLDCMVAPLLLLGHLLWGRDFSKAGLTQGANPQASSRGERLLKATMFAFRSWR